MLSAKLPAFSEPPVAEVIIAVEFVPLSALDTLTLISLHDSWKEDYPVIQLQPAIAPNAAPLMPFEFIPGLPPARLWSLSPDGDVLLQAQNDRLIINWRRRAPGGDVYPHYDVLAEQWSKNWAKFRKFLDARGVASPEITVAEVSYVNLIDLPEKLDAPDALRLLGNPGQTWPAVSRQARTVAEVAVEPFHGHLSLQVEQPSVENRQVHFSVVTRLAGDVAPDVDDVRSMLDVAHGISVNAFAAATTDTMHKHWGMAR